MLILLFAEDRGSWNVSPKRCWEPDLASARHSNFWPKHMIHCIQLPKEVVSQVVLDTNVEEELHFEAKADLESQEQTKIENTE